MSDVTIARAAEAHGEALRDLRRALWPDADDIAPPSPESLNLLAWNDEEAVGFAEASIRHDYVNGCDETPVAFLEGLYVMPAWRRRGIASAMIDQVAAWGAASGCRTMASDATLDNGASHAMHRSLGFRETERVVFFRRDLPA